MSEILWPGGRQFMEVSQILMDDDMEISESLG